MSKTPLTDELILNKDNQLVYSQYSSAIRLAEKAREARAFPWEIVGKHKRLTEQLAAARRDSESLRKRVREQLGWFDFGHLEAVSEGRVALSGDCVRDLRSLASNLQTLSAAQPHPHQPNNERTER